ncbi:phosphotransferase [Kaistia nematophila]|uniref:Phosphotransferase n=1 Tax=Kaistia nematophila TaxID=2994654 RepID=A0A9X3E1R2_9HYPH|nr:phosphotransferase [Kaistia nematophila]MCX5569498.1 phosphotransferase [Kaistia nematophila]
MNDRCPPLPTALLDYLASVEPGRTVLHRHGDQESGQESGQDGAASGSCSASPAAAKIAYFHDPATASVYEIHFDQHSSSTIRIDLNRLEVHKKLARFIEHGIEEREIRWLTALESSGLVPRLIGHSPGLLRMNYVGEPVRRYNLPADWRDQAEAILAALASARCCHNDIKCDNLMVRDGRITLVDFGWATADGDPIPSHWPQGIGRQHRLGVHRFDDRHAIHAALASAERDEVDRSIILPA